MRDMMITLTVNGKSHEIPVKPNETLLDILRNHLHVASVKATCWQGDCGLCTILIDGVPIKSCLVLAHEVDQKSVTTVEGLSTEGKLTKLQESFIQNGAVQCGFCTPAFILLGYYLLEKGKQLDRKEIQHVLNGIICRCTGYKQIIDSILSASSNI
ncbi:MAG: (2Fe-2S)-binding protein [Candidatus Heimdallarchaeota archaeon]|nr:MAG: (2Fe-2S)-binding protein [Candidatus Heimdallarchaeota archaeon]